MIQRTFNCLKELMNLYNQSYVRKWDKAIIKTFNTRAKYSQTRLEFCNFHTSISRMLYLVE